MVVERMRRGRISIRFALVLRVWLGTFARRSLRYVGGKMKMRVADTEIFFTRAKRYVLTLFFECI